MAKPVSRETKHRSVGVRVSTSPHASHGLSPQSRMATTTRCKSSTLSIGAGCQRLLSGPCLSAASLR